MLKPSDRVANESARVLREANEFMAAAAKAEREGRLYDFLGEQAALPESKPAPRPLTPMEARLAEIRRVAELCRRPLR